MAAELVSCRRSAFVLYVRYCFLLLRSAVHSFSKVGSQLELHRINFLALNAVLFDCCMHYPQFFFWKWRQCRLVCCFLLGFERAHCTVKPTRAHLSVSSLPWLFFLLGLGGFAKIWRRMRILYRSDRHRNGLWSNISVVICARATMGWCKQLFFFVSALFCVEFVCIVWNAAALKSSATFTILCFCS